MSTKAKQVLVVDDDSTMLAVLARLLRAKAANSAQKGIELAASLKPRVVVWDAGLGLDQLHLVAEVSPDSELVVVTGYPNRQDARQALRLGASAYVSKDDLSELLRALDAA